MLKKLRDITQEEWKKILEDKCCRSICSDCIFNYVNCCEFDGWLDHKELYSDKFLDQKIEIEDYKNEEL